MAPGCVYVLVISAGVMSVTGLMARWMIGYERSEIKMKSFIHVTSFTISSDTAQKATGTEGVLNTQKAQVITNFSGTESMKMISGTSEISRASSAVATAKASQQTTAETAASPAGSVETTAGGTTEEVKIAVLHVTKKAETLETAETTPDEMVTTCTEITESTNAETSTHTTQITLEPERISVSNVQTHKSETDVAITVLKQESEPTSFAQTITTANSRSATPIPEPLTDRVTNFIAFTSKIPPENKATTKTSLDATVRTTAIATNPKADLTEVKLALSTVLNRLKTTGRGPFKVETSETAAVRPQESTQAVQTSIAPATINRATGMKLLTMIQTATGTQAKTEEQQLSTGGKSTTIKSALTERKTAKAVDKMTLSHKSLTKSATRRTKARSGQEKKPLSYDKTLYSAITMGCILVICAILALTVFIKDFIRQ